MKYSSECVGLKGCGYWYQDEDDDYPCCHYPALTPWPAPCEYDCDGGYEDD